MIGKEITEEETAKFQLSFPCPVEDLQGKKFDEEVVSPVLRTVHNGVAFEWVIAMYPGGCRSTETAKNSDFLEVVEEDHADFPEVEEVEGYAAMCLFNILNNFTRLNVPLNLSCWIDVAGKRENSSEMTVRRLDTYGTEFFGDRKFIPINSPHIAENGNYVVNGTVTFCCILHIPESAFEYLKETC